MDRNDMLAALKAVQAGDMTPEAALGLLVQAPFEDIGYAKIDHHRQLRNGNSEVIYGAGKTAQQIAGIVARMIDAGSEKGSYVKNLPVLMPTSTLSHALPLILLFMPNNIHHSQPLSAGTK